MVLELSQGVFKSSLDQLCLQYIHAASEDPRRGIHHCKSHPRKAERYGERYGDTYRQTHTDMIAVLKTYVATSYGC